MKEDRDPSCGDGHNFYCSYYFHNSFWVTMIVTMNKICYLSESMIANKK